MGVVWLPQEYPAFARGLHECPREGTCDYCTVMGQGTVYRDDQKVVYRVDFPANDHGRAAIKEAVISLERAANGRNHLTFARKGGMRSLHNRLIGEARAIGALAWTG
jgi:hypothetical protein